MKNFSYTVVILSFVCLLLIVWFNYKMDAFGIFNPKKDKMYDTTGFLRTIKPFWFRKGDYNGMIVGTSRAHNGFDPDVINEYSDINYFNYGQSALSYVGANQIIKYAKAKKIENYIVLLDTYLLPNWGDRKIKNNRPNWLPDYTDKKAYNDYFLKETLPNTVSVNALNKSIKTLLKIEDDAVWKSNGLNSMGYNKFQGGKSLGPPLSINFRKGKKRKFTDHKFEVFKDSFNELCDCNGEVLMIFPPVSMYYLSAIEYLNYGETYRFKLKITDYVMENMHRCSADIKMYDYMNVNSITSEDLTIRRASQNYRDPSHFRTDVGNKIIKDILQGAIIEDGIVLTKSNYKKVIEDNDEEFKNWFDTKGVAALKAFKVIDNEGNEIKKQDLRDRREREREERINARKERELKRKRGLPVINEEDIDLIGEDENQ